ncbi:MAG: glycoside hydrolase family 3 C-terminal domain-containing protein [Clostridiales Family XIII bacterium]|jgi:beta-glucosidase|nr:glycoside hydrolase family 3 C-terminal domain-containing protein [Clostridiales Family XIII bacterium]
MEDKDAFAREPARRVADKNVDAGSEKDGAYRDGTVAARVRAAEYVATTTLWEKAALCSGRGYWYTKAVKRLGLDSVMLADGPHGLRRQGRLGNMFGIGGSAPATCFPTASLTACSFDRELLRELGEAIAEEAAEQGVGVVLGPGVNIKRSPLGGRNFEYFSEDPYLSGELGAAFTRGVQGSGVGACVKHFAGNSQETNRMVADSVIDERALREIYLPAFEKVVKEAKPAAVMCSYNRLNGTYSSESKYLLTDILRDEWGYEGLVVSDWGATADRAIGLAAGLDLEMPGSGGYNTRRLIRAVKSGRLPESALDKAAARVAALALAYSGEPKTRAGEPSASPGDIYERHGALARRAAAESTVLLKNERGALPLRPGSKIAVVGEFALKPRYQGAGSSRVNPTKLECALYSLLSDFPDLTYASGYRSFPRSPYATALPVRELKLIDEAVKAARGADAVVLFAGLPAACESEGFDRDSFSLPTAHERLIRAVCAINRNTVVVIQAGAPVDLTPAADAAALLYAYLGGQAGGGAIADILTGRVNPSGKLAETFPREIEDTPCHGDFGAESRVVNYAEGALVGYRHYEAKSIPVAYPFGYGLSYTTFAHTDRKETDLGGGVKRVSVTVTNTGDRAGAETVLFYDAAEPRAVSDAAAGEESAGDVPYRNLRGFEKVFLEPGERATLSVALSCAPPPRARAAEAEPLAAAPPARARFDMNSTPGDIKRTPAGFLFYHFLRFVLTLIYGAGAYGRRMTAAIANETPLRAISTMSGGLLPRRAIDVLIALANLQARGRNAAGFVTKT